MYTGQIIKIRNKPIFARGRLFTRPFIIRVNNIYTENNERQANYTVIEGEPGIKGITRTEPEKEIA